MGFSFATCERGRALGFLKAVYPKSEITDTPESAKDLLDLVEADIVRIQDPAMHGPNPQIIPSTNYDESKHGEYFAVCSKFHETALRTPKVTEETR